MSSMRPQARSLLHAFLLLSLGAIASVAPSREAHAALPHDHAHGSPDITLQVTPVLEGNGSSIPHRFTEIRLRVGNSLSAPFRGKATFSVTRWNERNSPRFLEVPVSIDARASASLQVPLMPQGKEGTLHVTLEDAAGETVNEAEVGFSDSDEATLLDLGGYTGFAATFERGNSNLFRQRIRLVRPSREDGTANAGDPWVLPQTYAGYSSMSATLVDLSVLVGLGSVHAAALTQWLENGGTLAINVDDPALVADPRVERYLGKSVAVTPPTGATATRIRSLDHATLNPLASNQRSTLEIRRLTSVPKASDTFRVTHDFAGPNVTPSPYGASIDRGLGTVVLLGFDPHVSSNEADAFTHAKMYSLTLDAQEHARSSLTTLSHRTYQHDEALKRALDPNEGFRFGLVFAAGLLCVYAILVGPILFFRARKRGTPLAPYVIAPAMSAVTFGAILGIGSVSRGLSGGSRRVAIVEQAAGETRGTEVVYRGFYPPGAMNMDIRAESKGALLDFGMTEPDAVAGERFDLTAFSKGEGGMRVHDVRTRPWRTFVVREYRTFENPGTIDFETTWGTEVVVTNRTSQPITRAFVSVPDRGVYYVGHPIAPGESIRATEGTFMFSHANYGDAQGLRAYDLQQALPEAERSDFTATWGALSDLRTEMSFWPRERAVLIGELDHDPSGHTPKSDSGLAIRKSRTFVRVLGRESTPGGAR